MIQNVKVVKIKEIVRPKEKPYKRFLLYFLNSHITKVIAFSKNGVEHWNSLKNVLKYCLSTHKLFHISTPLGQKNENDAPQKETGNLDTSGMYSK